MAKKCKCGICGKEFKSLSARREHKRKEYSKDLIKSEEVKQMENNEEIVQEEIEEEKETLKQIPKIAMPKEQAKVEWKKYCEVLKKRKEKFLQIMKDAHYQMKEGKELIDVYKVMKQTGLNENNQPRLAIARADLKQVYFIKQDEGTGFFSGERTSWNGLKDNVALPQNTFKTHWKRKEGESESSWNIEHKELRTKVPIIPIEILPDGALSNYYVLWETNEWEELPETKDPLLLKRISENLFAILGSWDLTELEQSIISGGKI